MAALLVPACAGAASAAQPVSWDWQLSPPFDLSRDVAVMDLDPDNHTGTDIAALKAHGVETICYVSVGTAENWREDADSFPQAVVGKTYGDWPDEKFLDIRQLDVLLPIMEKRFARCAEMGFDAVEPDNVDVFDNDSGFDLSAGDAVTYLAALAAMAHAMGLKIGQKNAPELSDRLSGALDFFVAEECFADGWCAATRPYADTGKPVFAAEYSDTDAEFSAACSTGAETGISFILKTRDLDRSLETCP